MRYKDMVAGRIYKVRPNSDWVPAGNYRFLGRSNNSVTHGDTKCMLQRIDDVSGEDVGQPLVVASRHVECEVTQDLEAHDDPSSPSV